MRINYDLALQAIKVAAEWLGALNGSFSDTALRYLLARLAAYMGYLFKLT